MPAPTQALAADEPRNDVRSVNWKAAIRSAQHTETEVKKNHKDIQTRKRITVKDVARELGMSVSTVSRAFYPDAYVADATREVVLEKARVMGYKANPFAQSLITKRTRIVGVVVSDLANPFYPEIMTRLTADLHREGMNVMLITARETREIDAAVLEMLTYQPDLVIILAAPMSTHCIVECEQAGSPCIFFNRLAGAEKQHGVTCDNLLGGSMVANYLADLGHRRLAYVSAFPDASTNVERGRGFADQAEARGLERPFVIEAGNFNYDAGFQAGLEVGALSKHPDAVFCASDIVALGFIEGIRSVGLSVPDDISVVGFDDVSLAAWPSHSLTTVKQPIDRMLAVTVELAAKLSSSPNMTAEVHRIAPGALVERKSTKARTSP